MTIPRQDSGKLSEQARALAASLRDPDRHLDFDSEIAPYVDGRLDAADREIVESHLDDCAMCRGEVEDLRAMPRPQRARVTRMMAIAAGLTLALSALFMFRSDDAPSPVAVPQPRVVQAAPAPVPAVETPRPSPGPVYERAEWTRLVESAVRAGRLPVPDVDLDTLRPRTGTLRGAAATASRTPRLAPAGVVVESTRPRFSWPARSGASYVVFVYAGDEPVEQSETLSSNEWTPKRALPRGKTYAWQVEVASEGTTTLLPEAPAPPARFRVIDARTYEELEAARTSHPTDALLHAVLLARSGMVEEAEEALEKSDDPRAVTLRTHS